MFLEAQFGAENVDPIKIPRLGAKMALAGALPTNKHEGGADGASEGSEDEERELDALHQREIQRLLKIGIPVPGVEIRVDKNTAKVWLEDLEIECPNRMLAERVRVVLERAVEVTAPLWT